MTRLLSVHLWVPVLLAALLLRPPDVRERWFGPAPDAMPTDARRLAAAFSQPVTGVGGPPPFAAFDARNPFLTRFIACYGRPWNELRHAGEDWFRPAGAEVHAIADGRVVSARDAAYPGAVVIVEHTLAPAWRTPWGGATLYSVYAHLEPDTIVRVGATVRRGDRVGNVVDQAGGAHVHFELRRYGDLTGIQVCPQTGLTDIEGRGYTAPDTDPTSVGYLNPSRWLAEHRRYAIPN